MATPPAGGRVFVAGTDTDVGKTVVAGLLALCWEAHYWKPVQSGSTDVTDSATVAGWIGPERVWPEAYLLRDPVSPHLAARRDGVAVDVASLRLPEVAGPLVVEGAGGVLSPVSEGALLADLIAWLELPMVLVALDRVGVISQTLLALEALRTRGLPLAGVVLSGGDDADAVSLENRRAIEHFGDAPVVGRVPRLPRLDADAMRAVYGTFRWPPV